MKKLLKVIVGKGLALFPLAQLEKLLYQLIAWRATTLPSDESLRFLFRLDANLYALQGQRAIVYGDGVHTKHRI